MAQANPQTCSVAEGQEFGAQHLHQVPHNCLLQAWEDPFPYSGLQRAAKRTWHARSLFLRYLNNLITAGWFDVKMIQIRVTRVEEVSVEKLPL